MDKPNLTDNQRQALLRWRLVLGKQAERPSGAGMGGAEGEGDLAETFRLEELAGGMPERDVLGLDGTLGFLYDEEAAGRPGGLEAARPHIPRWLADVRRYFPQDVVAVVQRDAIERRGFRQLLFEPETLSRLTPNIELAATLIALQRLIPDETRETARAVVRQIADELRRKLENDLRQAVIGGLARNRGGVGQTARNLDWPRTIRRNLRHYDPEHRRLVPERVYFWANQRPYHDWQIVIGVDQSGSMAQSLVHASLVASVFATVSALRTTLIFFDTDVADLSDRLDDPVDLLFGAQLGGGTDIARAVAYATRQIVQPDKTLFLLISDLFEGGDEATLLEELRFLVESRVKTLCLLALSDEGRPAYNHTLAQQVAALGIPTFACTPRRLVGLVEAALAGQPLPI